MSRLIIGAALLAALLLPGAVSAGSAHHHPIALVLRDNVAVHAQPNSGSQVLAVLVQQTQVEMVRQGHNWDHVRIWDSVTGWVLSPEVAFRRPWETVSTYHAPEIHYHVHAYPAALLSAQVIVLAPTVRYRSPGSDEDGTLPAGSRLRISAWLQDARGKIWYRVGKDWVSGDAIQFLTPDPGARRVGRRLLWSGVSGKGMWLTLGTVATSAPQAVVSAAIKNGITHLYLESAISPLGFHGKSSVGPLIEAAHRQHITVIAWVYPYLYDLASDVALTRQVAAFRTAHGDRFDGIAADLETNVHLWTVRAYSQLIRAYLGPDFLLVGVTFAPQWMPTYPFAEVAHDYNLLTPMDYWHMTKTAYGVDYGHLRYGYDYGYRYAVDSVSAIRRQSGDVPIAPIGQTFDNFGRLEMGPHAPSQAEIDGFLAGSKTSGAVGVSFFQWMTAADEEWRAIHDFHF